MAGSMSWFDYKGDTGGLYAVKMDTSNGNAIGNTAASSGTVGIPKGMTPRFFVYVTDDNLYTRKIVVSDPLTVATPPVTLTLGVEGGTKVFKFAYSTGEKTRRSRPNTGQTV